jgi:mannose-6-phosphate isomerase-like protein (cupin superfamily)
LIQVESFGVILSKAHQQGESMQTLSHTPTVMAPGEGKALSVLGDRIICKFNAQSSSDWRFFELVGTAQSGPPPHSHPWAEGYYILEGEVQIQVGNHHLTATPGSFIDIPAHTVHTFTIQSPQAKFLFWVTGTEAEQFFEELDREVQEFPPNMEKIMDIAQKHQVIPAVSC